MSDSSRAPRINLFPHSCRVPIYAGDTLVADPKVTHCLLKGDTDCYSPDTNPHVAWSYQQPTSERLRFDADKVGGRFE
ncbi:hypothetical protein ACUN9Y_12430 [Halomonas sp. V046]|uniref:hypothetical protein n=1 Tax=Halomonas sp. V046 TaxID=3459611 RepID=UPI00404437B8